MKHETTERIIDKRNTLAAVVSFLGLIQFLLAVRVAAARYPGGFSFGTRFLSEMGETHGPAGVLFNRSIILLGSCLAFFFVNGFRDDETTVFRWSGVLSACGLIGIGSTPLDKFFYEHHLFLILWLVPMFPMIIAGTIGSRISGLPGMLLGIVLLFLTVRYITSAGSNQAPWNQKLVIVVGLAWMVLAGFHVLRKGLQEINRRLRVGEDPLTESYLQRLQADGLHPSHHCRNSDQHRRHGFVNTKKETSNGREARHF